MIFPTFILLAYIQQIATDEESNIVTVCNSTYCDELEPIRWCCDPSEVHVYVTSQSGQRFRHSVVKSQTANCNPDADFKITINPCKEYRKIIGFGGALTDASALMISCLSKATRKKLLDSYFHCEIGIGYYLLRIPLAGSDFSKKPKYTYDDTFLDEPDPKLNKFALDEMDLDYKIPIIKEVQAISCRTIIVKGATWYAPEWMTSLGTANTEEILTEALPPELAGFAVLLIPSNFKTFPQNRVKDIYLQAWAEYLCKTIKAYREQGVRITYVSPGNEPQLGAVSNHFPRDRYQKWVTDILCPVLQKCGCGNDSVHLLALDDQTVFLPYWQEMLKNPDTKSCFKGVATHWYFDFIPEFVKDIQSDFCEKYPDLALLPTESSACEHDWDFHLTSDWHKAVRYAKDIILKLAYCGQGYIDWNIVLDFQGGPNWIHNYCYAAVAVNCSADEFHKRALFYVLGHFSKFLPEGSVRIDVTIEERESTPFEIFDLKPVQVVAFKVKSPNCRRSSIVIVALNENNQDVTIDICLDKGKCTTVKVPENSIISSVTTLPWNYACF